MSTPRQTVIVAMADASRAAAWRQRLATLLPGYSVVDDTEPTPADRIRYAVVWKPRRDFFGAYPRLRAILSIGAGVEEILSDPTLPEDIAIVRMIDDALTAGMRERGACVINASRGECLVEDDLLAALDSGHIAGATLDVFEREPLPPDHPFWNHPKMTITPHVASLTALDSGARHIAAAIDDLEADRMPLGLV